jgi:hypothetical protein
LFFDRYGRPDWVDEEKYEGRCSDPVFVGAGDVASCDDRSGAHALQSRRTAKCIMPMPSGALNLRFYPKRYDWQFIPDVNVSCVPLANADNFICLIFFRELWGSFLNPV